VADSQLLIMNLMRVLTPEEINDLTTTYCGEKRVSLTSLMVDGPDSKKPEEVEEDQNQAKILPFNKKESEVFKQASTAEEKNQYFCGEEIQKLFRKLYGLKENSMAGVIQDEAPDVDITIKEKKSASTFILEEKVKLESSQRKLKSSDIIKTYKQVLSVDLEIEKKHKDDLRWSSSQGQLINKKQA